MRQVVSVDIDGTIALALETLCAAVNAKCGTQYTMFDISNQGWHHAFEDDPEAQEWAQTFLNYAYGSHMATIGFYKAMAPDIGGIAAVNMLHKAGVHVIISTLRDVHMYSVTKWWLDHWGVQYDELNCSPNSKFVLAAQGPMVFVDDSLKVAVNLVAQGSICYLLSRPLEPTVPKDVRLVDTWAPILDYFGVALDATQVPQLAAPIFTAAVKKDETVNITKHYSEAQGDGSDSQAAGIAVVSQGSGRVLMLQRDNTDKDKKAASRLEFPGGRLDANESAWAGALREWQEETGNELPEGEIVATWDNDHGPYRLFVYVIATESEIHLNPDKDDMEVVDPDHPHASQPEVAAWYYPKDLATAKKMVRKELRKFDWSVLTDAVDGKERPKMMVFDLLKGFGDPGSTQERETNGEFGPGTGSATATTAEPGKSATGLFYDAATIAWGAYTPNAGAGHPGWYMSHDPNNPESIHTPDAYYKDAAATQLAEQSGLSYERCNELLGAWAASSSDTNVDSVALQTAVAQQFGVSNDWIAAQSADFADQGEDDQGNRVSLSDPSTTSTGGAVAGDVTPATWVTDDPAGREGWDQRVEDANIFVSAMYDNTQTYLASQGITDVTLMRGEGYASVDAMPQNLQDAFNASVEGAPVEADLTMNPASSWTTDETIASEFADNHGPAQALYTATFPASQILSTPMSGIGCFKEREMVVIGGQSAGTASIATYDNDNSAGIPLADNLWLPVAAALSAWSGPNYTGSGSDH